MDSPPWMNPVCAASLESLHLREREKLITYNFQQEMGILGRSEALASSQNVVFVAERAARDMFILSSRVPLWMVQRTSVPLQFYPPATPSSSSK
jgi:hypothetical protein